MKKFVIVIVTVLISHSAMSQTDENNKMININGIDLYYEVYGEGEPLLLLHGWTQSSGFWEDYVAPYAQHFKVYALDLRGHGNSSPLTADFSIKKTSEDIVAFLNHLNITQAKAVGLSFGALTLLEMSSSNPQLLKSMVLIGAAHQYKGGQSHQANNTFSFENLPAAFIAELNKTHHHGERQIRALFNPDLSYNINLSAEELSTIECKTLIVHGDRDEIVGVEPAMALHDHLPNSQLWIVPNTGHLAITGVNRNDFLNRSLQFLMSD